MTNKLPPLPSGSVDVGALHDALAKGTDPAKALEKATSYVEPKAAPETEKPATKATKPTPAPAEKADGDS